MQVDFVMFRRSGERLSAFVATLGYSRMSYVRFVADETWPTVKARLQAAFGGPFIVSTGRALPGGTCGKAQANMPRRAVRVAAESPG